MGAGLSCGSHCTPPTPPPPVAPLPYGGRSGVPGGVCPRDELPLQGRVALSGFRVGVCLSGSQHPPQLVCLVALGRPLVPSWPP